MKRCRSLFRVSFLTLFAACAVAPSIEQVERVDAVAPENPSANVASEPAEPEVPACVRPPRPLTDEGVFYVQSSDPAHPRVRYLDGQVSLNDSCAIRRGSKLSRRVPPMFVNGQPIGFC